MKRVALYARVSTIDKGQDVQTQLIPLRTYAEQQGRSIYNEYIDHVSGGTEKRPWLDQLMSDAQEKKFDIALVWRFDRMSRSTAHLINTLNIFKKLGIDFVSHQEHIDTSTPTGQLMFTIIGAFAQFEKQIISERVKAWMHKAKSQWKIIGRKQKTVDSDTITMLRESWLSYKDIAKQVGCTAWSVQKVLYEKPL